MVLDEPTRVGADQHQPAVPYTPGMEYSGEVAWRGAEVAHLREGDRVYSDIFNTGARSYDPKYQKHGGFSSFAIAPGVALRPIPVKTWSFDQVSASRVRCTTPDQCMPSSCM